MVADEAACFKRIQLGGPWKYTELHHEGKKGTFAHRGDFTGKLENVKVCSDGLVWSYIGMPSQDELAKSDVIPRFPVTLKSGRLIEIPLAVYAPRIIAFDGGEDIEHATEFGREAYRIWQMIDSKNYPKNNEIKRLVFLAIQQCYSVTEELLGNLAWVTDADIVPITLAVSGRDPKSAAVAGDTLALPAAAS